MSAEVPEKKDGFDVVLLHGATDDGEGARVLRARPGSVEAGEVRPVREGRPLAAGGEVVRLEPRAEGSALYDVHVECKVPAMTPHDVAVGSGPPQVATPAYRESWERTFGGMRRDHTMN